MSPDPIFAMFRARDKSKKGANVIGLSAPPPPGGDKEGVYYTLKKQKHAEPGEFLLLVLRLTGTFDEFGVARKVWILRWDTRWG